MRILATSALALLLAGCGANITGVGVVAPSDVRAYYQETAAEVGDMTAGEYLVASIAYTNQKCTEYFDQLAKLKEDSNFLDQVIMAGIAAGTPLATVYGVGAATVGTWAAGAGLANELQKDAANIYLFAEFKEELKPLVFREMQSFMVKNKLAGILDVTLGFRSMSELPREERVADPARVQAFLDFAEHEGPDRRAQHRDRLRRQMLARQHADAHRRLPPEEQRQAERRRRSALAHDRRAGDRGGGGRHRRRGQEENQ